MFAGVQIVWVSSTCTWQEPIDSERQKEMNWKTAAFLASLAGMAIMAHDAVAETIGTACLAKSGEVYALAPYRSAPRKSCFEGDETVRLSLHQPNTAFAKRSASIDLDGSVEMARFDTDLVVLLSLQEDGTCELFIDDLIVGSQHVVIRVPQGSFQDGLREVTDIENDKVGPDGQKPLIETYETNRVVFTNGPTVFLFHDAIVDNRGSECFGAFFVEAAQNMRHLYDR
jgi:hypothetical protein